MTRLTSSNTGLLALAAALFMLYLCATNGVVTSNDGSQFATARSLILDGTTALQDGKLFALNDVARGIDGELYANRPPGTALIAAPFYWLGARFQDLLAKPPSSNDRQWHTSVAHRLGDSLEYPLRPGEMLDLQARETPQQYFCALAAVIAGVACCLLTAALAREIGASDNAALATVAVLGTGTLVWRYSTALFSHIFSTAILLLELYLLVSNRAQRKTGSSLLFGCLLALDLLLEYQTAATLPLLVGYLVWTAKKEQSPQALRRLLAMVLLPSAAALVFLGWYHAVKFGSPFMTALTASSYLDDAGTLGRTFGGSPATGVWFLFLAPRAYSLFSTSPVVTVALMGYLLWPARLRGFMLLLLAVSAAQIAPILVKTVPWGGLTSDHRYILRIVPLLVLPLGLVIDRWSALPPQRRRFRNVTLTIFLVLAAVSLFRSFESVAFFGNHSAWLAAYREPGVVAGYEAGELFAAVFTALQYPGFLVIGTALGSLAVPVLVFASGGANPEARHHAR